MGADRAMSDSNLAYSDPNPTAGGTPLVLIHGFPLDRRIFAPVLPILSASRRVITVDLPGFGESKVKPLGSMEDAATRLRAFLTERKLLPCVLGGLSMGGYVSLAYSTLFGEDLKGLVLIDTKAAADTEEAKENRNRMAQVATEKGANAVAKMMQPKMLAPITQQTAPEIDSHLLEIMNACPPETIAAACIAMRDRADYTEHVKHLKIPLRVIAGVDDAITPAAGAKALAESSPDGSFVAIENAGHISTLENPQAVARALEEFMAKVG